MAQEPYTLGNLSGVVPMDDMKDILKQMWKSRSTEPRMGELYKKYHLLVELADIDPNPCDI